MRKVVLYKKPWGGMEHMRRYLKITHSHCPYLRSKYQLHGDDDDGAVQMHSSEERETEKERGRDVEIL